MGVTVKDLSANIELKNSGMELEVRAPDGTFKGDLVVTKSGLIWCEGKQRRENGTKVSWDTFIAMMNPPAVAKAPKAPRAPRAPRAKKAAAKAPKAD